MEVSMPFAVGIILAIVTAVIGRYGRFDRDRAFYSTVAIVVGSYYVLFAAMSGSIETVFVESIVMAAFVAAAITGFRSSSWIVAAALAAHGIFDLVHRFVIENSGVPAWWPIFCMAYDVGAAGCLAWVLALKQRRAIAGGDLASLAIRARS
jgi:hypothetical protein